MRVFCVGGKPVGVATSPQAAETFLQGLKSQCRDEEEMVVVCQPMAEYLDGYYAPTFDSIEQYLVTSRGIREIH